MLAELRSDSWLLTVVAGDVARIAGAWETDVGFVTLCCALQRSRRHYSPNDQNDTLAVRVTTAEQT